MKLQIAIDLADTETALKMVEEIQDVIDIVEVGTPMIVREGMLPVRSIRQAFPHVTLLADVKIVDGGDTEAEVAYSAGADIVTVLALAEDATIRAVVSAARKHKKQVMADMLCVGEIEKRAAALDEMGVDYICIHTAVDVQNTGKTPFDDLGRLMSTLKHARAVVAGGIQMGTIPLAKKYGPEIVVAGSALSRTANLRSAVLEMKDAMNRPSALS